MDKFSVKNVSYTISFFQYFILTPKISIRPSKTNVHVTKYISSTILLSSFLSMVRRVSVGVYPFGRGGDGCVGGDECCD